MGKMTYCYAGGILLFACSVLCGCVSRSQEHLMRDFARKEERLNRDFVRRCKQFTLPVVSVESNDLYGAAGILYLAVMENGGRDAFGEGGFKIDVQRGGMLVQYMSRETDTWESVAFQVWGGRRKPQFLLSYNLMYCSRDFPSNTIPKVTDKIPLQMHQMVAVPFSLRNLEPFSYHARDKSLYEVVDDICRIVRGIAVYGSQGIYIVVDFGPGPPDNVIVD